MADMHIMSHNGVAKNYNKVSWAIRTLWMMYVLFPFRLKGISIIQNIVYYGVSLLCVCLFVKSLFNSDVDKKYLYSYTMYLIIFLILVLLTYIVPITKNTLDFSYLSNYGYYFGRLFILTGTVILVGNFFQYINLIIDAIDTYVVFSIILLIPTFHNSYMRIVMLNNMSFQQMNDLYSNDYYTRFGLQGFSGFGCTIMSAIAILLCCYMIVEAVQFNRKKRTYIVKMIISIIGTALYGRSGFLISLVIISITIIYLAIFYQKIMALLYFITGVIVIFILFIINAGELEQINSIRWMFEGFFNYLNYGHFTTTSSNHLSNMFVHPSLYTFLYGDGYYTMGGQYYMSTDVGFLRPLLFWGIMGELLYYSLLVPVLNIIKRYLRCKNGVFFIVISLIFIFLFEFKGEVLLTFSEMLYAIAASILLYTRSNRGK